MGTIGKPFTSGNTGKQKGTVNKLTKSLKQAVQNFVEESFDQVMLDFQELSPKERCQMWAALVQYCLPKKATMELMPAAEMPEELLTATIEQLEAMDLILHPEKKLLVY
jgi:hypothetical protein